MSSMRRFCSMILLAGLSAACGGDDTSVPLGASGAGAGGSGGTAGATGGSNDAGASGSSGAAGSMGTAGGGGASAGGSAGSGGAGGGDASTDHSGGGLAGTAGAGGSGGVGDGSPDGTAGRGGADAAGGSGGGDAAASDARDGGAALDVLGDAGCKNDSPSCRSCIMTNCTAEGVACVASQPCSDGLAVATACVCGAQNQTQSDACEATFHAINAQAAALETCIANSCKSQCGL